MPGVFVLGTEFAVEAVFSASEAMGVQDGSAKSKASDTDRKRRFFFKREGLFMEKEVE
jgi:hypothetical protein